MSSTMVKDRKGKHLDFYETPARCVDGLIGLDFIDRRVVTVLEPCAGKGAIVRGLLQVLPRLRVTAVEIQEEFQQPLLTVTPDVIICDFLQLTPTTLYDRIVANPPFSQAEEFIRHSYEFLTPNGQMAFLLRLPFVAGVKRYDLFKSLKPSQLGILSQRPKFGGDNIDSCDYAWIIWERSPSIQITTVEWIEPVVRG